MNELPSPHIHSSSIRFAQTGFTLIELIVTLAISAILLSLAAPAMASIVESVRLSSSTNLFMASLRLARSESAKRGGRVALCTSAGGQVCEKTGGWERGWIVFHDTNNDGDINEGEALISRVDPLDDGIRLSGNVSVARYISYWSGSVTRSASGAMQAGTLTVCNASGRTSDARQIVISSAGRARVQQAKVASCL